jgi:tripartite ATP-independent transporter DctM subunit
MIVYSVLAEESVGRMFLAGIIPGLLLASIFSVLIICLAHFAPQMVFVSSENDGTSKAPAEKFSTIVKKGLPIFSLIALVLGGMYAGWFTATEAGGVGAAGALVLALLRRSLGRSAVGQVLVETGHITATILFLVMAAMVYAQLLAMSGLPTALSDLITGLGLGYYGFLTTYLVLLLLLGCIIDPISIMLIVLPIALPVATSLGMDLVWFGIITIVAVEVGLLTPPFGISAYTVKAALPDNSISTADVFRGAMPFVLAMLLLIVLLTAMPSLVTSLARS